VVASIANQSAEVSWLPPSNDGDSPILDYTVTWATGSKVCQSSPCMITGLVNGTAYSFQVLARNEIGESSLSSASENVTPATTPDAPTNVTATIANQSASLTWDTPSNNGSAITGFKIIWNAGSQDCQSSPCAITGLTNGTAYSFQVAALNALGESLLSSASESVTPATTPDAPEITNVEQGNSQAVITWSTPPHNGRDILSYKVSWATGSKVCQSSPCTITGLTNGTAYSFQVAAINEIGDSAESSPSQSVTPATIPAAPSKPSVTRANKGVQIRWSTPADNGSPITGYKVSWLKGSQTCTSSPCTVTNLQNGTRYVFSVSAINAIGESASSENSVQVIPAATPGAPRSVSAKSTARGQATLKIGAALANGDAITRFEYRRSLDGGKTWTVWSAVKSESVTSGWRKGTNYLVQVRAVNAVGFGPVASVSFKPAM
jgi:hypothetical protein